jgi:SAM-dependent methyltransferase
LALPQKCAPLRRGGATPDMDNILRALNNKQIAVDLGRGGGSFSYASYQCKIIGIDVALNLSTLYRDGSRIQYLRSTAAEMPIAAHSVDAFICNHTFEHFPDYKKVLSEISRVLKPTGMLWIAVPDGYGFDDALYRFIFGGGGHLNRFTHDQLVNEVQDQTDLRLVQSITLFSGFVYLKKPTREQFQYFPRRARFLFHIPDGLSKAGIFAVNAVTRFLDRVVGSRISRYGWGFVFARDDVVLDRLPSYFNVCWKCGSGNDAEYLKSMDRLVSVFRVRSYSCSNCQAKNLFFKPPEGFS